MPPEHQLDIEQTFESQKDLVTQMIVSSLMKTLDLITYLVREGVIYEMIHRRHHHKREHNCIKKKSEGKKNGSRKKHRNSQRLEVNINFIFNR